MEERKSQCDGESEVFDNLEELKESFQKLANFFGFTTQIRTSNKRDIIKMEQEQNNKYISYRRSKNNDVNDIMIGIHSDDPYDQDMYFAIEYDKRFCRLRLHKPTYEMYSKIWHNNSLVGCTPYTIHRDSCIDVNMKNCSYYSHVYGGVVILTNGNYSEQRPVVGKFSLPSDIAINYEKYGYKLYGNPGELGGFYKKELEFTPERSREFIRNILRNSKYLPCLIANTFQELGCTETCDASEIFRLMVSLLPQQFVTDFFGDEETYQSFLMRLEPKNISTALKLFQDRRDARINISNMPNTDPAKTGTKSNNSTVPAENLELLNRTPNLTCEIIEDKEHGHGIKLSINDTQCSILFSDNVINISCDYMKILVNLNIDNPQLEINNTDSVDYLYLKSHNFTGIKPKYDIYTTEKPLSRIDIDNPIEYIKQNILSEYFFTDVLKETISKFLSFCNINMTVEQLLDILYSHAPKMAAIIKANDKQPQGESMKISPLDKVDKS